MFYHKKGGTMKMFTIYVSMMLVMMHNMNYAYSQVPEETLHEYRNEIIGANISFDNSDDLYTIRLQFSDNPICFYIPRNFQESLDADIKRYLLPRTQWNVEHRSMINFMHDIDDLLRPFDIRCRYHQRFGLNFGIEILFDINSHNYEIKKTIDLDNKSVCFEIKLKN